MPRLLDLYCGIGGAARGYMRAGWNVVGVDSDHRLARHYIARFEQADAIEFLLENWTLYDAVHASPPCQRFTHGTVALDRSWYPDLIDTTRQALRETGLPYVIENVPRAPLVDPVTICGAALGCCAWDGQGPLTLRRHRLFESNVRILGTGCACRPLQRLGYKIAGCYGGASSTRERAENVRHGGYVPSPEIQRELMGIGWGTLKGLQQAVPPSYTYWIGKQLMKHLNGEEIVPTSTLVVL